MNRSLIITGAPLRELTAHATSFATAQDTVIHIETRPSKTGTSQGIYIDDIRNLQIAVRASRSKGKMIAILADASTMTVQSQNALLKLLEEPHATLQLILCTPTPSQLLETVRSRCQTIRVQQASLSSIQLPPENAARLKFMANGNTEEAQKLASNSRYLETQSKLFEQAKQFVGGTPYERLTIITRVATDRAKAINFIDACLIIYQTLLKTRYSHTLRDEAEQLLAVHENLQHNTNVKLQLIRFVVQ